MIDTKSPVGRRPIFGPYAVDRGHTTVMHSSSGFVPTQSDHIRQSELCATCHTLYTPSLDSTGRRVGTLPEQMPFLEWRHSAYRNEQSCQSCHMPRVVAAGDSVPITAVRGQPRPDVRRHWFPGGNFFVLGMLNRYRAELAVEAFPQELDLAMSQTREILAQAATVTVRPGPAAAGRVVADVEVTNLTGHKLPTAYPSRRAWLHVVVRDRSGATVFESGALTRAGRIVGNDNDDDRLRYEPHYREITQPGQVQIYESIMRDPYGAVTTGIVSGIGYMKDSRILPRGFDKTTANRDIAVFGDAAGDPAFVGGSARTRYSIDVARAPGPFQIVVELWYQPIGFPWRRNLRLPAPPNTRRFAAYGDAGGRVSGPARTGHRVSAGSPHGPWPRAPGFSTFRKISSRPLSFPPSPSIVLLSLLLEGCARPSVHEPVTLTLLEEWTTKTFSEGRQQELQQFTRETGIRVKLLPSPESAREKLALWQELLRSGASGPDVYGIDVIWPRILNEYFIDLKPYFANEISSNFRR